MELINQKLLLSDLLNSIFQTKEPPSLKNRVEVVPHTGISSAFVHSRFSVAKIVQQLLTESS